MLLRAARLLALLLAWHSAYAGESIYSLTEEQSLKINAAHILRGLKSGRLKDAEIAYFLEESNRLVSPLSKDPLLPEVLEKLSARKNAKPAELEQIASLTAFACDFKKGERVCGGEQQRTIKNLREKAKQLKNDHLDLTMLGLFREPRAAKSMLDSAILPVGSTYQEAGKNIKEIGTGTVLEIVGKGKFLLTAAHLLGGQNPGIEGKKSWEELNLQQGIISNEEDIALLPLPKDSATPAALRFDPAERKIFLEEKARQDFAQGAWPFLFRRYLRHDASKKMPKSPQPDAQAIDEVRGFVQTTFGHPNFYDLSYKIPRAPWAAPENPLDKYAYFERGKEQPPELVSGGRQVHANIETTPGMSGSVLLQTVGDRPTEVKGVLTQYNAFFRDSYFASDTALLELIDKYLAGKRGKLGTAEWKYKNGLTYRDYGNGTLEAPFLNRPSGNGTYVDPGNGTYVDPGNGTYVDPGSSAAVFTNDAFECLAKEGSTLESPGLWELSKALQKILFEESESPQAILDRYGLGWGMQYRGEQVIGFDVQFRSNNEKRFLLFANPAALAFLESHAKEISFSPVKPGEDLLPFALRKAKASFPGAVSGDKVRLESRDGSYHDTSLLEIGPEGIQLRLKQYVASDKTTQEEISLDAKGRAPGESQFHPILETRSPNGRQLLDIRQLYFTDYSDVAQALVEGDSAYPASAKVALEKHNKSIQLVSRNTSKETGINFVPAGCNPERADHYYDRDRYPSFRCEK